MTRDERLIRLERTMQALIENQQAFSERLTEVEVQARFALSIIKVAKRPDTALVTENGEPRIEIMDGWTAYSKSDGRDKMLDILEREYLTPRFTEQGLEIKHAGDPRTVEAIIDSLIDDYRTKRDAIADAAFQPSADGDGSDAPQEPDAPANGSPGSSVH